MTQSTPRVWLITGSSTGLGRTMLEEVLRNGEIAVATLRKPSVLDDLATRYPRTQLLVLPLDVTNDAQVKSTFVQAKDAFGRVDVVYNNAGQIFFQEAEGTPIDRARALMDINYWGAVTVSLEAVRFFREDNPKGAGGILVQLSSLSAFKGYPMIGFYCSSKAALDLFTEVLAQEVLPDWNIQFLNVHLGTTRTSMLSSEVFEAPAAYASEPTAVTTQFRTWWDSYIKGDRPSDAEAMTKQIWSVTGMDIADLSKGVHGGVPGLVNMYTGVDTLDSVRSTIGRLQDELVWNTKVRYEHQPPTCSL